MAARENQQSTQNSQTLHPVVETSHELPFSIGAAGLTVFWLFFHGRQNTAAFLIGVNFLTGLVCLAVSVFFPVPGIPHILTLMVAILIIGHFGAEGSKIAIEHKHYKSVEELEAGERGWNIAGMIGLLLFGVYVMLGFLNALAT